MKLLDKIVADFMALCQRRATPVDAHFAQLYVHVLARDRSDGLLDGQTAALPPHSACKLERFVEGAWRKYAVAAEPSVCTLRLMHCYAQARALLRPDDGQPQCERQQLQRLVDGILQYPETSSASQLEQMQTKMEAYIVASYSLGCPQNHVLLKATRQSLNSVIGSGDLRNYVLKKRYHRLEYLQRLGATVAGILIYNNHGPHGEKEHMRNVVADLDMALANTRETLQLALRRALDCKEHGYAAMTAALSVQVDAALVEFHCAAALVREVNSFVVLFSVYERYVSAVSAAVERIEYLIGVGRKKLLCVVAKIDEVLQYRTAIESELIFPHFVYLAEVWRTLVLHLSQLAELNRLKDQFDGLVTPALEARFRRAVERLHAECGKTREQPPRVCNFTELIEATNRKEAAGDFLQLNDAGLAQTCTLTLALTQGLLLPAQLQKKLCENLKRQFGFANIEHAKYAERHFAVFLQLLRNTVYSSMDMLMFFDLAPTIVQQDTDYAMRAHAVEAKHSSCDTQTESTMMSTDLASQRINGTWNVWDFHRETIRLANIRRRQTHATQSALTYGRRAAQQQAYNTRTHTRI